VGLEVIEDTTTMTRDMINGLVESALFGAILAMSILFLFLRSVKSTIIIGVSIPFSFLVTLLMMNLLNLTLNLLTMTGLILGLGLVVDCSIVILENIFKYRERGAKPAIAAILGSREVMTSIISSTLTTLCVFVPIILFINDLGEIGLLVKDLIITVGISLSSSLFIAIFLVPILASKYLTLYTRTQKPLRMKVLKTLDDFFENGFRLLTKGYGRLLSVAVGHRFLTTLLVIAAFVSSVLTMTKMQITLNPDIIEDTVYLNVTLPQGTLYEDTKATLLQIQEIAIAGINGMKSITANIGQSSGFITIALDLNIPEASAEEAKNRLRSRFGDFPNAEFTIYDNSGLSGGPDIGLALRINDIDTGLAADREIKELLEERVPELIEVSIDANEGLPQVEVVIDRNRAYNLGLSVSAIAGEIAAALNGVPATTFRSAGNEYSVVLELREEDREKLPDLGRIFVASNTGNLIPLSNFATLEKSLGPVSINKQNQAQTIHITGTFASRSAADRAMAREVEGRIREILDTEFLFPEGLFIDYEGLVGELDEIIKPFIIVIILAIILVFGTMAGVYESFKDPFINIFSIPLVLIGIVAIYSITGHTMNLFTMVGLVMLVGIVTNNGIILVDYTNLLVGRGVPVRQACIEAGESRLRPVLMTALTTIFGLTPLAFFPSASGVYTQDIGLTVIGGLVSSTFITLFFIPVLYSALNGTATRAPARGVDGTKLARSSAGELQRRQ
jgi:HAE1 family hydrophobic/amphiphilic exporter-1